MIDTSKLIPQRKGEARLSGKTITTIGLVKKDVIKVVKKIFFTNFLFTFII